MKKFIIIGAKAAKLHGRDYIGFELNPEYIKDI